MEANEADPLLPGSTLVYREYEALLPDDTRVTVAVTLDDLWDGSDAAMAALAEGAVAHGHILILEAAGAPPMAWACNGAEARIVAASWTVDAMQPELQDAIGSFLLHFLAAVWQEFEPFEEPATVH
jgi:hypothetical protein